jgi:hypothetical protein
MKPQPITPSQLDTFKNCGLQFYHLYVAKDLPREEQTAEQKYGDRVHKAFEDRVGDGKPLPRDLEMHEPYLKKLADRDGVNWVEEKCGLNKQLQPCSYDDPNRFWRGKIDYRNVARHDPRAKIVDYKTGKPHDKWDQLSQYALHTFALFPQVNIVDASFYWTQTCSVTRKVWARDQVQELWDALTPDLKQLALAYKSDVWQERPSGLCKGWCRVKDCQHWEPPRKKR